MKSTALEHCLAVGADATAVRRDCIHLGVAFGPAQLFK